jgi:hypothetical protein
VALREFVTAVQKADEGEGSQEEPLVFNLDGHEMRAYKPTEGQYALLVMSLGRHANNLDRFAGMIDFFIQVLDEDSERYVVDRMMNRDQIIPLEKIVEMLEWMVEEWGGRPFQSSSGSTTSQPKGGKKSTRRTPALT